MDNYNSDRESFVAKMLGLGIIIMGIGVVIVSVDGAILLMNHFGSFGLALSLLTIGGFISMGALSLGKHWKLFH